MGEHVGEEMKRLKCDEVRFDRMGKILGRSGNGLPVRVYDSHLDFVELGNVKSWPWDPLKGEIEDGVLYARGACDEKGSTPAMVCAFGVALDLMA